jgi:PAS domain S-box-containing protein
VRESIGAGMKKIKRASHAARKFSANGAVRKNGAPKRSANRPDFKHPKTELEAATQRYADLFELAPIGYVTFDRVGRIEEINLAAAQLLGGPRARLIGVPFALYVTKDDDLLFLNHLLRCRSSDRRVETELHLKKRDGDIIPARLESSPMTSSMRDGARLYQTAILDLTAEGAIRQSEERYRALFNLGPMAVYTIDTSGVIQEYNRTAAELWGREPAFGDTDQRFCGSYKMFRPDGSFMPHDQCPMAEVASGKISVVHNAEVLIERPDGSHVTVLVNIRPLKNDRGEVTGAINCFYDITERKQIEEQLAEQARLLDLTSDAILVRDAQDRITYWNDGARELYGYSRQEALGKVTHKLLRTVHPESRTDIRKKLEDDNRWRGELIHTCKDGTKVVVMSRWSLDRDAKGRPAFILETNTEITERKRAERRTAVNLAITRILSESPALADAIPRILRTVCETLGWEVGDFWTPKSDGRVLRCLVSESRVGKFSKFKSVCRKLELAPGIGLPGRIWSNLKPTWIADITKDNNFPRASAAAGEGLHSAFAFPISFGKHFVGVMEFFSLEIRERDEDVLKIFGSIGSQIGQFVQRKRAEAALQKSKELLEQLVRQRTKALRMSNAELKSEIQRRKGLEGEILAVSDREQQRLGQELHDGLCQHLTAVAFMARSVALRLRHHRVIDAADIEKIAELVNSAAGDTRELSRALHRVDVDAAGLVTALQDLVDREIWKIPCRLQVRPSFHIEDNVAAAHLYRIAREAVINANKHAQAREIVIKLERSQQGMVLRVIDDGVGVPVESKVQKGLGFHIMNYRAQLIGGRLRIERPKKGGTSVSCYFSGNAFQPRRPNTRQNGRPRRFAAKITKALAASI